MHPAGCSLPSHRRPELPGHELRLAVTQCSDLLRSPEVTARTRSKISRPFTSVVKRLAAIEPMSSLIRQYIWLFVAKLIEGVGLPPQAEPPVREAEHVSGDGYGIVAGARRSLERRLPRITAPPYAD